MKHISFLANILAILILASCQTGNRSFTDNGKSFDSTRLQVAVMPTADCLPLYYAEKCGIFDQLDAKIDLHSYRAQMDCDTAIINGWMDVIYTDLIRCVAMYSNDSDIRILWQTNGYHKLVTTDTAGIKTYYDLPEHMVSIARHSTSDFLLDTIVGMIQVDPLTVYHPQVNDILLRYDMLQNHTIEAAVLPDFLAEQALSQGAAEIYDSRSLEIPLLCFASTQHHVNDSIKIVEIRKLKEAYQLAVDEINAGINRDSVRMILEQNRIMAATMDSLDKGFFQPLRPIQAKNIHTAISFLKKRNQLKKHVHATDLIYKDTTE